MPLVVPWPGGHLCAPGRILRRGWLRSWSDLQEAFPAFSFGIGRGWRGLTFEAWRNAEAPGVYALITSDADELWHELEAASS